MKLALIGYGKMGKVIEEVSLSRNHHIKSIIDVSYNKTSSFEKLENIDVAIDFTNPNVAVSNILKCFELQIPVVVGTTGWLNDLPKIEKACALSNGSLFYASNFSLGVNILFELNRKLANIMNNFNDYEVEMTEIHHLQKLDSPSGTALSLAKDLIQNLQRKKAWVNNKLPNKQEINITSKRIDKVPGTHTIKYESDVDTLEITHVAKNRIGFALGAVLAAEFLNGKKGVYTMKDLLKF